MSIQLITTALITQIISIEPLSKAGSLRNEPILADVIFTAPALDSGKIYIRSPADFDSKYLSFQLEADGINLASCGVIG